MSEATKTAFLTFMAHGANGLRRYLETVTEEEFKEIDQAWNLVGDILYSDFLKRFTKKEHMDD